MPESLPPSGSFTNNPIPTIPDWTPPLDTGQPSADDLNALESATRQTVAAANSPIPIVYGRDRLFGKPFVVHVDEINGFLYVAYGFCKGEINSFEKIYVDGIDVNDGTEGFLLNAGAAVEQFVGTQAQSASTNLSTAIAGYSDALPGLAYVVLKIPPESTQGFPRVEAIIQGLKVYDPRDSELGGGNITRLAQNASPTAALRTASVSVEAWVELRDGWDADNTRLDIFDHTDGVNDGYRLSVTTAGEVEFQLYTDTSGAQSRTATSSLTTTLTDGAIHHIAATYDSSMSERVMRVYLDGEEVATNDLSSEMFTTWDINWGSSPAFEIGVNGFANVQDLRAWNDLRAENEIRDNRFNRLVGNEAGLAGYWPIYETSGTNINDHATGSPNDLTADGSAALASSFVGLKPSSDSPVAYSDNPTLCFADYINQFTNWYLDYTSIITNADENDRIIGVSPTQESRKIGLTLARPKTVGDWNKGWRVYMGAFLAWENGYLKVIPNIKATDAQGALKSDGASGSYVDFGDIAAFDFGSTQDFSIELTAKHSGGSDTNQLVIGKRTGTGAGWAVYANETTEDVTFTIDDGTNQVDVVLSEALAFDNDWHTLQFTVDRTGDQIRAWVNGVEDASSPFNISAVTGALDSSTSAFRFFADNAGGTRWDGFIDDVRIWNDIRTPTELSDNRLIEIHDPDQDSSLIGYWKCNEDSGATILDASSASNDGTINGEIAFVAGYSLMIPDGIARHFTADDIVENGLTLTRRSVRGSPTVIQVSYTDATNDTWRSEVQEAREPGVDEGTTPRRISKISLPGIHRPAQARREAIERLNWFLSDLEGRITVFDEGLELQQGSIIAVTHPIGLSGKLFRVRRISGNSGRWTIDIAEYDPLIYSEEVISDPSTPDTNLGNPLKATAVTGLVVTEELFKYKNGITGSRVRATWNDSSSFTRQYIVEGYVNGTLVWNTTTRQKVAASPGVEELVDDVPVEYEVKIYADTGYTLSAATLGAVDILGKLAVPGDVPGISATLTNANTAKVTWQEATDIDIWRYDLRIGTTSDTFSTATKIDLVDGLNYVATNLPLGTSRLFVKAVDTVGNQSNNAAFVDVTTALPSTPSALNGFEIAAEVRLNWPANAASEFVERYRITYDTYPTPTSEKDVDIVDSLRMITKDVPEGTYTFSVYAINAQGESTSAATRVIEVTTDQGAFLADDHNFNAPVTLTNIHSWTLRDFPNTSLTKYVTNMGDVFDNTAPPHDFDTETVALANYHSSGASTWLSETKDFTLLLTGNWILTHDTVALDGTVNVEMELSTDNMTWDVFISSARGEYRYARVRITTSGDSTSFIMTPVMNIKINVVPIEENGEDTASATPGQFTRIELTREYAALKEVNAQPKVTTANLSAVVDNIIIGRKTAIQFDGTNYLESTSTDPAVLDFGSTQDFTIEGWVLKDGAPGSGSILIAKRPNSTGAGWQVHMNVSGEIVCVLDDGTNQTTTIGTTNIADNTWHHFAVAVDRTGDTCTIYIDGSDDTDTGGSITTLTGSLANTNNATIGATDDGLTVAVSGICLTEIRVWDDIRTTMELTANDDIEIDISSANLVGYWRCGGSIGASISTLDDQLTTPLGAQDLDMSQVGMGDLTYCAAEGTNIARINYFDVYVFDIFGQQIANQFQWNWKGV